MTRGRQKRKKVTFAPNLPKHSYNATQYIRVKPRQIWRNSTSLL